MSKNLKFNFIQRTFLYGGAGIGGITIDTLSFYLFSLYANKIPLILINLITYHLGTFTSFVINKKFAFRSQTHILSFLRFYLTSILGMLVSTLTLVLFVSLGLDLFISKVFATLFAVTIQYFINSSFSIVIKK